MSKIRNYVKSKTRDSYQYDKQDNQPEEPFEIVDVQKKLPQIEISKADQEQVNRGKEENS